MICISKKSSQSFKNLDVNGSIANNPKIISNTRNQFFCEIPKKIESEIVPTANKYHDHLVNSSGSSFFIQPATDNEDLKYTETLKNHKTNGPSSSAN